jgi:hypothetical protein
MKLMELLQALVPPKVVEKEVIREVIVEKPVAVEKIVYVDRAAPLREWENVIPDESIDTCVKRLDRATGSQCDFIRAVEMQLAARIATVDRGNEVWRPEKAWARMQGDCTERSLLAVVMLEKRGIKSKVICGYAMVNGQRADGHARVRILDPVDCEPSGVWEFEYHPEMVYSDKLV